MSLYWYSQVISLDRGLQEVILAVGRIGPGIELHIRGHLGPESSPVLHRLIAEVGMTGRVVFHDPVPPDDLLSRAAEHDVGLCLEVPHTENRDLCITNKLFIYLLAGLVVVATRTHGQRKIVESAPGIGFLYDSGNVDALADTISRLRDQPDLLARGRAKALQAAEDRWNWEHESRVLVAAISGGLAPKSR